MAASTSVITPISTIQNAKSESYVTIGVTPFCKGEESSPLGFEGRGQPPCANTLYTKIIPVPTGPVKRRDFSLLYYFPVPGRQDTGYSLEVRLMLFPVLFV